MSYINFEDLISPFKLSDFIDNFYSQKYLHIKRKNPDFYAKMYSLLKFDKTLNNNIHTPKYLKLAKCDESIDFRKYSNFDKYNNEHIISIDDIFEKFKEGYSIVLDGLSRIERNILNFEKDIMENIPFIDFISSNVYLTPENNQAFPLHYDTQEVFIIQIYGSKIWELYPGIEKLYPVDYSYDNLLVDLEHNTPKKITLNQGDLLYLPRGYAHKVYSEKNSLHITVSIYPFTNRDIAREILESIIKSEPFFTKTLTSNVNIIQDKLIEEVKKYTVKSSILNIREKNKGKKYSSSDLYLNSLLELDIQNSDQYYFMRKQVVMEPLDNSTEFKHNNKVIVLEGDYSFLNNLEIFRLNDLYHYLKKDLAEEFIYYMITEGFFVNVV